MEPLRKLLTPDFFEGLDDNLKTFAKEVRKALRHEGHVVIGVTGYPGVGKSNDIAILGALIDEAYAFDKNICFIPTSKQIGDMYMQLPKYSFFHIDEASRGLHKHKWHDKVQQKINELYDTERENHYLCTALIMPRFQNFTENFRNFMITIWVNIPEKGLMVFYKKDDDKDAKDPWHIDESYKKKLKSFGSKKIFERTMSDKLAKEMATDCYWFHCQIPAIPKEVWALYQEGKKESRNAKEPEPIEEGTGRHKLEKRRMERWDKIRAMKKDGKSDVEIAREMGLTIRSVRTNINEMRLIFDDVEPPTHSRKKSNICFNNKETTNLIPKDVEDNKVLNVAQQNAEIDKILEAENGTLGSSEEQRQD
jgi:hypothetical protein